MGDVQPAASPHRDDEALVGQIYLTDPPPNCRRARRDADVCEAGAIQLTQAQGLRLVLVVRTFEDGMVVSVDDIAAADHTHQLLRSLLLDHR